MKPMYTALKLTFPVALAVAALALAGPASAQTATTTDTTSASTATAPSTSTNKKPPTSATADMVNEAIQRSQARAAKAQQSGVPEQWGSEEPFTYDPNKKNFTAAQQ